MSGYLTQLSGDIRRAAPEPARGFAEALTAGADIAVVAEIKRASPSQGSIAPAADVAGTARAYAAGGATAMSVLCAERDFGGSLGDLTAARRAAELPALAKDFTVFTEQVAAQRLAGADAILVILALVSDDEARRLLQAAELLGMDALVEAHSAAEVERALGLDAHVVGVNARDLDSLAIDRDRQLELARLDPAHRGAGGRVGHRLARRRRGGPRCGRRRGAGGHGAHAPAAAPGRADRGAAMTLVKICGLTRAEDVDAAVAAGADLVGFVLVPGTPAPHRPRSRPRAGRPRPRHGAHGGRGRNRGQSPVGVGIRFGADL